MSEINSTEQLEQGPTFAEALFEAVKPHLLKASQDGDAQAAIQAFIDSHAVAIQESAAPLAPLVTEDEVALRDFLAEKHVAASRSEADGGQPYTLVERVEILVGRHTTPGIVDLEDHFKAADVPTSKEGRTLTLLGRVEAYAEMVASASVNEAVAKLAEGVAEVQAVADLPDPASLSQVDEFRYRIGGLILTVPGHVLDDRLSGVRGVNNHDVDEDDGSVTFTIAHNFPQQKTLADVAAVILNVTGQDVTDAPSAPQPLTKE